MTAKTQAQRSKDCRERKKYAPDVTEVRGLYAPKKHHAKMKRAALAALEVAND